MIVPMVAPVTMALVSMPEAMAVVLELWAFRRHRVHLVLVFRMRMRNWNADVSAAAAMVRSLKHGQTAAADAVGTAAAAVIDRSLHVTTTATGADEADQQEEGAEKRDKSERVRVVIFCRSLLILGEVVLEVPRIGGVYSFVGIIFRSIFLFADIIYSNRYRILSIEPHPLCAL